MKKTIQKRGFFCAVLILLGTILTILILIFSRTPDNTWSKHRLQWWLSAINWDSKRTNETGKGVRIAILDSGVDEKHPDLQGRIESHYRVSGLEGKKTDFILHGTAVAGIIIGRPAHEKGILGMAVDSSILSIDVTDKENGNIEVNQLIEGIEYAIKQNVDIINISAGVKKNSDKLYQVVKKAYEAGIVIVASSGNYMKDDLLYPAKYDEVIAAGALAKDKSIISPKGNVGKQVIYLPGENIVTTGSQGGYIGMDGTSAAAPILTGIISLMKEKNKQLTNDEIVKYFNSYNSNTIDVRKCLDLKY